MLLHVVLAMVIAFLLWTIPNEWAISVSIRLSTSKELEDLSDLPILIANSVFRRTRLENRIYGSSSKVPFNKEVTAIYPV